MMREISSSCTPRPSSPKANAIFNERGFVSPKQEGANQVIRTSKPFQRVY